MVIINLCGPPAGGKSSFASRFILENPDFTYLSIDEFRIQYKDETLAWEQFYLSINKSKKVIMETSGLSWRLNHFYFWPERPIFTILFTGNRNKLQERLKIRQKRSVPMPYHQDEQEFLDWAIENNHNLIFPVNLEIDTTQENQTIEDIYLLCCSNIANFRVKNSI